MRTLHIIESVREAQSLADVQRARGLRLAVVPTMGALHEGHRALIREARARADRVWVTIFVNPTQFGPSEDLSRYPRTFERDLALCRVEGVDVVFAPSVEEMYPAGSQTWVQVEELTQPLCGRDRPVHFRGVTTVVTKLFQACKPHLAVFGEKDFQQLAVVRRMVRDLLMDVQIVGVPIVREADGVALSSRNALLSDETRREATVLVNALDAAEAAVAAGERRSAALNHLVRVELEKAPHAEIDYAELRDPQSLESAPPELVVPTLLALAVRFTTGERAVRLIDNRVLCPTTGEREQ